MLSPDQIIRAWTDAEYRATLSPGELAQLPDHPAGLIELTDDDLENVSGGNTIFAITCGFACSSLVCSGYACTAPCFCSTCSW